MALGDLERRSDDRAAARRRGRTAAAGGSTAGAVARACRPARRCCARPSAARVPVIAEVELAFPFLDGTGGRDHRPQRQEHDHDAHRRACSQTRASTVEVCGNIGEPLAAQVDGPPGRSSSSSCRASSSRPIAHLPRRRRGAAQPLARPSRSLRRPRRATPPPRRGSSSARTSGRRGAERRRSGDGGVGAGVGARAGGSSRAPARSRTAAASTAARWSRPRPGAPPSSSPAPTWRWPGSHNVENAMAAALLALAAGGDRASAAPRALRGFDGLPHRLAAGRASAGGVVWYDDSKGTNVGATAKSLEGFADGSRAPHPRRAQQGRRLRPAARGRRAQGAARLPDRRAAARELERALAGAAPASARPRSSARWPKPTPRASSRRRRAAVAGLRQLRPVPRLHAPRAQVPGAGRRDRRWRVAMAKKLAFDKVLFTTVLVLARPRPGDGLLGERRGGARRRRRRLNPFLVKQSVAAALGLVAMAVAMHVDYRSCASPRSSTRWSARSCSLLVAVLFAPAAQHHAPLVLPRRRLGAAVGARQARARALPRLPDRRRSSTA